MRAPHWQPASLLCSTLSGMRLLRPAIEPGIYLPDEKIGVRIEDTFYSIFGIGVDRPAMAIVAFLNGKATSH